MKTVHIISHSHWDREWYLPYERHHMLLIELMDDILELFETDPEFNSFYLDGQTIILDDYLQVRPEKESLVRKYIENGKLKIGPFYILQDAFLTSSESNVRNMLMGHFESNKWGAKTEIGYYPDTFGNVGQTPQLMKQLGFDMAAFGRGVKPTGFANNSNEEDNFVSSYSEMNWQGADGTEIYGLLFANWYSNGNEIPSDKEKAKVFWDKKLEEAEQYASTNHLLFMNGCDHQPVQKDLSEAIRVANELYVDYCFVHSNFTDYMSQMINALPYQLDTVKGELTSQETEGWYTLTNTASSRVYLKQENAKVSRLLENIAEPLAAMAYDITGKYPHDVLEYAWKLYMQNHPHDSICGCSVDEVHEEMMTRFQKADNVAQYVIDESLSALTTAIDTTKPAQEKGIPFVVFNTTGEKKRQTAKFTVDLDKVPFQEMFPTQGYQALEQKISHSNYQVIDDEGNEIKAAIKVNKPQFDYDLPKDAFRQPYMVNTLDVEVFIEDIPGFSWKTYYLVPSKENNNVSETAEEQTLQNNHLKVKVNEDGSLNIWDKTNKIEYNRMLVFEDTGDIGNEYVYKKPNGEKPIYSLNKLVDYQFLQENAFAQQLILTHELEVPVSADEQLETEQQKVIEFRNRKAQRVSEAKPLRIITTVTLYKDANHLTFKTILHNEMKDHRLRVLFKTPVKSDVHYADSIFETVKRPNKVSEVWTNPENPQRMHHYIQVIDEAYGLTVEPEGLNEYEVLTDEQNELTVALTLYRSVGEMGDWGYFPTPGAQCMHRDFEFTYHLSFHSKEGSNHARKSALQRHVPLVAKQLKQHQTGQLPQQETYLHIDGEAVEVTALKRSREKDQLITRLYNFSDNGSEFEARKQGYVPEKTTILEKEAHPLKEQRCEPHEIMTLKWKKEDKFDHESR